MKPSFSKNKFMLSIPYINLKLSKIQKRLEKKGCIIFGADRLDLMALLTQNLLRNRVACSLK